MQSKDLMFSISKNPQASMDEVLAKVERYINGEEFLAEKLFRTKGENQRLEKVRTKP